MVQASRFGKKRSGLALEFVAASRHVEPNAVVERAVERPRAAVSCAPRVHNGAAALAARTRCRMTVRSNCWLGAWHSVELLTVNGRSNRGSVLEVASEHVPVRSPSEAVKLNIPFKLVIASHRNR